MGKIVDMREKSARKRATREVVILREVNAYVNHHKQESIAAGLTSSKTMHHGVDLCTAIAKARKLNAVHRIALARFEWAIVEQKYEDDCGLVPLLEPRRFCVLMVKHPDGVYVLGPEDHVSLLTEYSHRVLEMTVDSMVGRWEVIDASEQ